MLHGAVAMPTCQRNFDMILVYCFLSRNIALLTLIGMPFATQYERESDTLTCLSKMLRETACLAMIEWPGWRPGARRRGIVVLGLSPAPSDRRREHCSACIFSPAHTRTVLPSTHLRLDVLE